ncbi:MAG: LacI family DNA-binding transcriptional regulator [Lachnospiraceae bacterium]|nr:LacI family DNA-binding transcriptional regulator [Lachnospiraceae bacterium]MBQ7601334.1 LacI family DNA-binding transcriptional regulator [Lachnospiraceae bacterium]
MVTITDISKACGVSRATVSKALNGASDVSPETTKRIREAAAKLGYLPNAAARALKMGRSYNIGVLFSDATGGGISHEYFSLILESVKAEAERLGYDITFISKDLGQLSMDYYEHAKYRSCDGVVIASADFEDPAIRRLATSEIPTVTLDYSFDSRTSILSDNVQGMDKLVRFVYEKGHRKIAFIHGEITSVTQKRLASFRKVTSELGLRIPQEFIREARYHDPRSSGLATRALLELSERPTCILYPDDLSFLGGMSELEKHGLSVPKDMSVAGYDGIPLSQVLRPRLTTYRQGAAEMGKEAARLLVGQIERPETWIPEQVTVEGELLTGDTVSEIE